MATQQTNQRRRRPREDERDSDAESDDENVAPTIRFVPVDTREHRKDIASSLGINWTDIENLTNSAGQQLFGGQLRHAKEIWEDG